MNAGVRAGEGMLNTAMQLDATIIASTNRGKISEYSILLSQAALWGRVTDLLHRGGEPPGQETGESYLENAVSKARHACEQFDTPAIGDDGGIEVSSLGGIPGLRTARFTRAHGGPVEAMRALAQRAGLVAPAPPSATQRVSPTVTATAHCAVALSLPDGRIFTGASTIEGALQWPPLPDGPGLFPLFRGAPPWDAGAEVLLHRASAFESLLQDIQANATSRPP